jgi:hypothetical protein
MYSLIHIAVTVNHVVIAFSINLVTLIMLATNAFYQCHYKHSSLHIISTGSITNMNGMH